MDFLLNLTAKIRELSSEDDLRDLYEWIWHQQASAGQAAHAINRELSLSGSFALKPDLPVLSAGSRRGLLVLAANPGWSADLNAREDAYCRTSPRHYQDLLLNFFERHPQVVGERVRWWNQPLSFIRLLRDGLRRFGHVRGAQQRWQRAHESRLIGGWELFPFHSESDGITQRICGAHWLHDLVHESLRAALRFAPEVLFIASKAGWRLVRQDLLPSVGWHDSTVGSKTPISYAVIGSTEVVAIAHQIFSAPRTFRNDDIFRSVADFRAGCAV